jgi:P-type Ca2+ transporter type 2C
MRTRQGLASPEAARRLVHFGPNELVPARGSGGVLTWLLRLVADPMVVLLAIAGTTYALLGDRFDALVVCAALLPIFAVTGVLEYRSDRALEELSRSAPPRARVVRDGRELQLPASEVVPGDTLLLREGDVIAADGYLLEATRLLVDEAALTGESLPVEKSPEDEDRRAILAGTVVRSGRGVAEVERTGRSTEYGRISRTLAGLRGQRTPIERSIHRIVFNVAIGVIAACILIVAVQRWHGDSWAIAIIAGVSLAMAAIPEELPMVYTLYLALGAWRLAKDNALVRRLSAAETLGSTTVICVDKTGTLTFGRLAVQAVIAVAGDRVENVIATAALAADADSGDPLDAAIFEAHGAPPDRSRRAVEIPFDPARRYAAGVWRVGPAYVVAAKGAYEVLLERCGCQAPEGFTAFLEEQANRGARVLAVARAETPTLHERPVESTALCLIGLIAFADTLRPAAVEAVAKCRAAGIRFIMITGDHPATARAIALASGLNAVSLASGDSDLNSWNDQELQRQIRSIDVFARVRPEQKLRIVRALHAAGEVVAMTGDGTNDALALREADIGVAMGRGGTEVARAAADLILLDDDVRTIVHAVADGRRIFGNLRHAFSYLIAFHAPLLLGAFLLPLLGAPILLLPIHLIWLELIVHPTSALVFENDPPPSDIMTRPPRKPNAGLLRRDDWARAVVLGGALAVTVVAIFSLTLRSGLGVDASRAAALIAMFAGQISLIFVERAGSRAIWQVSLRDNRTIVPIAAGTAASLALAVLWPPLARVLHLATVPLWIATASAIAGCLAVLWMQPLYALSRRPPDLEVAR